MKSWYQSVTVWFNLLTGVLVESVPLITEVLPTLKAYVPDNLYGKALILLTVGNILIRVYLTKKAVTVMPPMVSK